MGWRQFPPGPPDARAGALIARSPIFRRALHTFLKAAKMPIAHWFAAAGGILVAGTKVVKV
jgi:hypothetical protein